MPAQAEKWLITPKLAVQETLTNNLFLRQADQVSDLVTAISPGLSIQGKGARTSLRLDYGYTQKLNARESSANSHQQALNAQGMVEAIEDWLFVDLTGTISQQYLSATGIVSPSDTNVNKNQTETSSYSISPYIKGRLFGSSEYLLRYKGTTTSSKSSLAADLASSEWQGRINGDTHWAGLSWALDASDISNNYSFGKDYDATRYGATLSYRFTPQFRLSVLGGVESNNYASVKQESNSTSGYGFLWTPGPRTELSVNKSKRFFGDGYDVNFKHRMPRSLVTYHASKDVSLLPAGVGNAGLGSNYDLYYGIIASDPDFAGFSPEAIRAEVLRYLQNLGIPPNGQAIYGSLANSPNLSKRQEVSLAFLGARNTVTLRVAENELATLAPFSSLPSDPLVQRGTKQRGYSLVWGHQLTGMSSLTFTLNHQRSIGRSGLGNSKQETTVDGAYLVLNARLSSDTQANVTARHVLSDGFGNYTESALTGGLSHSF